MTNPYGPWATLIDIGGSPQLSAFWRRRLTMLVPTSQTSPVLSRRNLLWLVAAGVLLVVLPTLRSAPAMADEEKPAALGGTIPSGRIFLHAVLKITPEDTSQHEDRFNVGIIAVDPETGRWEKITDVGKFVRVSPDGKALAFFKQINGIEGLRSSTGGVSDGIWTYDLRVHTAARVLDSGGAVCWSPDGRQIVNTKIATIDGATFQNVTWQVNRNGSAQTKLPIPETDMVYDWSGDGKWLVTERFGRPPFGALYRMRPDGTEELRLTKDEANRFPRFSPDSRKILYLHNMHKMSDSLHVMDADGANDHEILREEELDFVTAACWSPDAGRLAVVLHDKRPMKEGKMVYAIPDELNERIEIMDADGQNRRVLPLTGAKIVLLNHPDWR